jgi:hypothetical protein
MGWRYVSEIERDEPTPHRETVDVVVDASWRIVRTRIETGSHATLLEARGDSLEGIRDGHTVEMAWGPDMHLDYLSPAFNAITTRRLEDALADGTARDIDVLFLEPVTVEPVPMRQRYELLRRGSVETSPGTFLATRWRYTALRTGWTSDLWVADHVVVRYDRAFELISYEPGASGPFPTPP